MEISRWWKSKDWIFQIILWSGIINLSLVGLLTQDADALGVLTVFGLFFGMFPSIAVVIIMQDIIIGEREAGTVQWILSKPCSRISFISSKIISNFLGVSISMAIIPGFVAYLLISFVGNIHLDFISYFLGIMIISVLLTFYLTMTIMLGTVTKQRGLVIGVPMLFNFGIISFFQGIKEVFNFVPHGIFFPIKSNSSLFSSIILNTEVETFTPLVITTICILIFITISLFKFNKEEF
jgi:ABC-type transport system involved in multi-copper enzyme maturation permease subunit